MSKYTTQIRWIVENSTKELQGFPVSERITAACPKIFNFNYPIWLEDYRHILERKILMHYYTKEICAETVGLWKLFLEERLNLIMPYYNELYKTVVKDYDWLSDTNSKETYTGNKKVSENVKYDSKGNIIGNSTDNFTGNTENIGKDTFSGTGSSTTEQNTSKDSKVLDSDLPQANYANLDYGTKLTEGNETGTSHEESTAQNDSTTDRNDTTNIINKDIIQSQQDTTQTSTNDITSNTDDIFTRVKTGATGSHSLTELLIQYRESLLNIDKLIIDELSDLFMLIY